MYVQPGTQSNDDGYNLFRRAIVERDEEAWTESVARYRPLLVAWANRYGGDRLVGERCDDVADQALARAWKALSPTRFTAFPTLAAVLAYLQICVKAVVIDCIRAQSARQRLGQKLEANAAVAPEQIVEESLQRAEIWRIASALAETPLDRIILIESFVYGLPPRTILTRHPQLFAGITAVYNAKRNLLDRLQRNHELRQVYEEMFAV
jgi:DNA-directed RNA polymerase specialized sigma24 family protein